MTIMRHERRWRMMVALVATAAAIGCGGSGASPADAAGSGGNGGGNVGGNGGGSGGAAGASGVAGRGGASGTGGTGGTAIGTDDRLLPLEVGRDWMFQQSAIDSSMASNCTRAEANVSGTTVDGSDSGWVYRPTCSDQSFDVFMNGDDIWGFPTGNHDAAQRFQYASAPVQEGASWASGSERYTWHDAGAVQTPAGRFERCWQRIGQSGAFIVLCRGVGLVAAESAASNYRLELAAKNF